MTKKSQELITTALDATIIELGAQLSLLSNIHYTQKTVYFRHGLLYGLGKKPSRTMARLAKSLAEQGYLKSYNERNRSYLKLSSSGAAYHDALYAKIQELFKREREEEEENVKEETYA